MLANLALNGDYLKDDIGYEEDLFKRTGFEFTPLFEASENTIIQNFNPNAKIKKEGDPCRKCGSLVILKPTKKKELKPNQTYYYEYLFICPTCRTIYMVDEAKRFV